MKINTQNDDVMNKNVSLNVLDSLSATQRKMRVRVKRQRVENVCDSPFTPVAFVMRINFTARVLHTFIDSLAHKQISAGVNAKINENQFVRNLLLKIIL